MAGNAASPLPDADARRRAATDFETNLVVLAGAGTGKTSLLVERALNAVGAGVATMDTIAAITFTEKAAGEMRERLAGGLDRLRALARDGGELDEAAEADRAYRYLTEELELAPELLATRALEAMERLDHGSVVTIHGFCAELLRAHPVEAGVDPGFVVDSGQRAENLRVELWEEFVRRELGADGEREEEWAALLEQLPLRQVGEIARALAGFAVPPALLEPAGAEPALEALRGEARRIAAELDSWLARPDDLTKLGERCLRGMRSALETLATAGPASCRDELSADRDLAERVESGGLGGASKRAGEAAVAEVKRIGGEARDLCRGILGSDDEIFDRLLRIVSPYVLEFRERYLRRGLIGFDGLLVLARDLLRDRPEVRRRLKRRFRLLLVDEFQDTDPLQYGIVLLLAERLDDEATDPYHARLEPGRLFVVGDGKQSIYRFRGADFAAYSRAVERIEAEGGKTLQLTGNFRSLSGIVDPVNELFVDGRGCWRRSDHQPDYSPITAVRPGGDEPVVELWSVRPADGARANDRREAEGRVVAEAIERWVEREKRCEYEQITLLFRAFTNVSHYLRPLRERGIPFVVDGGRDFLKRPEVGQLMATLQAIGRPADQPSLLAFLRSPAGGASDVELAGYARAGGRWSWAEEPDPSRFPRIAAAFATLRALWQETRELPVDRFVRRVVERTRMLPLGAAAYEGPQRVANLQKLSAAVGQLARDGTLSLEQVIDALEEGRLEEIETDRPLADDAARAVRVTNIHRIKGLENDVIILPDLAREARAGGGEPKPVRLATDGGGGRMLALRVGDLRNSARVWHDLDDKRHQLSEEVRVLYVALTRARERLVLVAGPCRGRTPWLEALAPWGFDAKSPPEEGPLSGNARVLHRVCEAPARHKAADREPPEAATRAVEAYVGAVDAMRKTARPPFTAPSALHEERPVAPVGGSGGAARAVGEALHRLLERWDGNDGDGLSLLLDRLCEQAARDRDADPEAVQREAGEILETFLASPLAERFARVERLGAEIPVLMRDDASATTLRGSIDLLYEDADGEIVVADYKTDRTTDADALRSSYGSQLAVYADAVLRALDLPRRPRMELWLLRSGQRITLNDEDDGPHQLPLW